MCGAAYCTDPKFHNTINNWSCNVCKKYPGVTATAFQSSIYDANGFVGYDSVANEVIVSFSGTDPLAIENWIDDLDFIKEGYSYCSGCEVHKGFYESYKSVDSTVKSLVTSYQSQHPSASISITGHSLGAAMAAHCLAELTHANTAGTGSYHNITTAYTFGMPRVGNEEFENWYKGNMVGTFRVVHRKDPVPHLAPENWGFHHMPYEVFYTDDYNKWKLCSYEGEDSSCSDQYLLDTDVFNHLYYLDFDFISNFLTCGL